MFPHATKKHLGQHFLIDEAVAARIAEAVDPAHDCTAILEIGPGQGALTKHLLARPLPPLHAIEVDEELVPGLRRTFPTLAARILVADMLQVDLAAHWQGRVTVVGNLPYNISSQIFFALLRHRQQVGEVVCMLQEEVAQRFSSGPGSRRYGILSVFLQAYYEVTYLFTVPPSAFAPPPKVHSGVIRLVRNQVEHLPCDERRFVRVVKAAFGQRRKKLRNALRSLGCDLSSIPPALLDLRAEALGVADFVAVTNALEGA